MDALLAETATRILSDLADSPESLWTALEDNGLTRVWAAEADGGFDLAPADGFGLMRLAGAHAAPVPLADTLMASRSEEHKSELQSLMRISYAVFCLKKKKNINEHN